ncbi:MAG: hypothetical protein KC618_03610, partial [Candidatus Omnitrophica bacterium]|nr:hypothetical protein [Candidatus Omnitrophota bacterium]
LLLSAAFTDDLDLRLMNKALNNITILLKENGLAHAQYGPQKSDEYKVVTLAKFLADEKLYKEYKVGASYDPEQIEQEIRAIVAEILGEDVNSIENDADFVMDLGMDSMQTIEFLAAVEKKYVPIPDHLLPWLINLDETVQVVLEVLDSSSTNDNNTFGNDKLAILPLMGVFWHVFANRAFAADTATTFGIDSNIVIAVIAFLTGLSIAYFLKIFVPVVLEHMKKGDDIREEIRQFVALYVGDNPAMILNNDNFVHNFDMTPTTFEELISAIEKNYSIQIPEEYKAEMVTVNTIVRIVQGLQREGKGLDIPSEEIREILQKSVNKHGITMPDDVHFEFYDDDHKPADIPEGYPIPLFAKHPKRIFISYKHFKDPELVVAWVFLMQNCLCQALSEAFKEPLTSTAQRFMKVGPKDGLIIDEGRFYIEGELLRYILHSDEFKEKLSPELMSKAMTKITVMLQEDGKAHAEYGPQKSDKYRVLTLVEFLTHENIYLNFMVGAWEVRKNSWGRKAYWQRKGYIFNIKKIDKQFDFGIWSGRNALNHILDLRREAVDLIYPGKKTSHELLIEHHGAISILFILDYLRNNTNSLEAFDDAVQEALALVAIEEGYAEGYMGPVEGYSLAAHLQTIFDYSFSDEMPFDAAKKMFIKTLNRWKKLDAIHLDKLREAVNTLINKHYQLIQWDLKHRFPGQKSLVLYRIPGEEGEFIYPKDFNGTVKFVYSYKGVRYFSQDAVLIKNSVLRKEGFLKISVPFERILSVWWLATLPGEPVWEAEFIVLGEKFDEVEYFSECISEGDVKESVNNFKKMFKEWKGLKRFLSAVVLIPLFASTAFAAQPNAPPILDISNVFAAAVLAFLPIFLFSYYLISKRTFSKENHVGKDSSVSPDTNPLKTSYISEKPRVLSFRVIFSMVVSIAILFFLVITHVPATFLYEIVPITLPSVMRVVTANMLVGFIVFNAYGDIFGQILNLRKEGIKPSNIATKIEWLKPLVLIPVFMTLFFGWFWPWAYSLWVNSSLPRPLYGFADQPFTSVISLFVTFSAYAIFEYLTKKGKEDVSFKYIYKNKLLDYRQALMVGFPF